VADRASALTGPSRLRRDADGRDHFAFRVTYGRGDSVQLIGQLAIVDGDSAFADALKFDAHHL
jgi:hypothetical protein